MFKRITEVRFPEPTEVNVNMMPIIMGDMDSVPASLRQYGDLIEQCEFRKGTTVYLSVNEGIVEPGKTQRRPGIHTDGTFKLAWGGGGSYGAWGGSGYPPEPPKKPKKPKKTKPKKPKKTKPKKPKKTKPTKGIYLASTDGLCRVWNCVTFDVDHLGSAAEPDMPAVRLDPSALYWITDRTPHEGLVSTERHHRQWFRLVADDISVWFAQHSTENPLGVKPNGRIEHGDKFKGIGAVG